VNRAAVLRLAVVLGCFAYAGGCHSDAPITEGAETASIRGATYGALLPMLSTRMHCVAVVPYDARGKPLRRGQDPDSLLLTLLRRHRSNVLRESDCEYAGDPGVIRTRDTHEPAMFVRFAPIDFPSSGRAETLVSKDYTGGIEQWSCSLRRRWNGWRVEGCKTTGVWS
jgi:hypothetical protein